MVKQLFFLTLTFSALSMFGMEMTLHEGKTSIKMGRGLTMHKDVVDHFLEESLNYKNIENNTSSKPEFKGIIAYGGGHVYYSNMGKLIKAAREGTIGNITLGVHPRLLNNQKTQKPINKLIEVAGDKVDVEVSSRYHDKSLWTQCLCAILSQNWSDASLKQPEGGVISKRTPIKDSAYQSIRRSIELCGKKYKGDGIIPVTPEKDKEKQEAYFLSGNIPKENKEIYGMSSSKDDIAAFRFEKLKEIQNSDAPNKSVWCSTMTISSEIIAAYTEVVKSGGKANLFIAHQGVTDSNLTDLQNFVDAGGNASVHNGEGINHPKCFSFEFGNEFGTEFSTQNNVPTISGKDCNTSICFKLSREQYNELITHMEKQQKDSNYTDFKDYKKKHIEKKKKQKEKKEQKKKAEIKSTKNTISNSKKRKRDESSDKVQQDFKKQKNMQDLIITPHMQITKKPSAQKKLFNQPFDNE